LKRPDVFGIGLLESTSMQYGNGDLLRETHAGCHGAGPSFDRRRHRRTWPRRKNAWRS
jgi:hypothetical protein